MTPFFHIRPDSLRAQLPGPDGTRFVLAAERGQLAVELYEPRGADPQQPHQRDELYVVLCGTGQFRAADSQVAFSAGDLLFVAAGVPHRFEDFSDDFSVWVMFYGPDGGDAGAANTQA